MSCSGIMVSKDFFVTLIIPLTDGWVGFHLAVIPDQASLGHLHAKLYSICLVNSVRVLMIHEIVQGKYGNERLLTDSRFVYGHFVADLSLGEAVVLAEFPETLSLRQLRKFTLVGVSGVWSIWHSSSDWTRSIPLRRDLDTTISVLLCQCGNLPLTFNTRFLFPSCLQGKSRS